MGENKVNTNNRRQLNFNKLGRLSWLLCTLFPFGFLSFISFIYLGFKKKNQSMRKWAITYFVLFFLLSVSFLVVIIIEVELMQWVIVLIMFVCWIISIIHATVTFILNEREQTAPLAHRYFSDETNDHGKIELIDENQKPKEMNHQLTEQIKSQPKVEVITSNEKLELHRLKEDNQRLLKRIEDLQKRSLRPEQTNTKAKSKNSLQGMELNDESSLRRMGYQITGLSSHKRWEVLERAVPKLGLRNVVNTIDGNIALRVKQIDGRIKYSYAIKAWNDDLQKLKATYYTGDFKWPPKR